MGRRPKDDFANLASVARGHIKRAEMIGKSLDERLKNMKEASDEFTINEDMRRDFHAVTTALQHAGKSLVIALESNKKDLGGMTEAQLEAQWNAELVRAATTLTEEQWQTMVRARAGMKQ
jgi:hypothetical protein